MSSYIKSLSKTLSETTATTLLNRRLDLQRKIDAWLQKSPFLLEDINLQDHDPLWIEEDILTSEIHNGSSDLERIEGEDQEEGDETKDEEDKDLDDDHGDDEELLFPEKIILPLPSSIGQSRCSELGLSNLAYQEIKLRQGQANECLHELRLALGLKSAIFRKMVRTAHSQRTKTRAWSYVHSADSAVRTHVRQYRRSRWALIQLDAPKDILAPFQQLQPQDLKISKDIVEENRVGQRNDKLSWLWRIQNPNSGEGKDWITEGMCDCFIIMMQQLLIFHKLKE